MLRNHVQSCRKTELDIRQVFSNLVLPAVDCVRWVGTTYIHTQQFVINKLSFKTFTLDMRLTFYIFATNRNAMVKEDIRGRRFSDRFPYYFKIPKFEIEVLLSCVITNGR
jgi:hypothetical protein